MAEIQATSERSKEGVHPKFLTRILGAVYKPIDTLRANIAKLLGNKNPLNLSEELQQQCKTFAADSRKVLQYVEKNKIAAVIQTGLSAHIIDPVADKFGRKKLPPFTDLNAHNLTYVVGYLLNIPFDDTVHSDQDSWRNYSDYSKKITAAVKADADKPDTVNKLGPLKAMIAKQFPYLHTLIDTGKPVLVYDELIASGGTMDFMCTVLKIIYPNADLRRGATWRDTNPKYQAHNLQYDIIGGSGPDIFEKNKMGSHWLGYADAKLSGGPALTYFNDKAIYEDVASKQGDFPLSSVALNNFDPEQKIDEQKIGDVLKHQKIVNQYLGSLV